MRHLLTFIVGALPIIVGMPAWAENYAYVARGESGEMLFTDQALKDAQRIEIAQYDSDSTSSNDQVEQMLVVAEQLRNARLAREAARERARRSREPQVVFAPPPPQRSTFIPALGFGRFPPFQRPFRPPYVKPPVEPTPPPSRPVTRSRFRPSLK